MLIEYKISDLIFGANYFVTYEKNHCYGSSSKCGDNDPRCSFSKRSKASTREHLGPMMNRRLLGSGDQKPTASSHAGSHQNIMRALQRDTRSSCNASMISRRAASQGGQRESAVGTRSLFFSQAGILNALARMVRRNGTFIAKSRSLLRRAVRSRHGERQ